MNMKIPSYHSDPHVTYLSKLLEEIREGAIQVPKFQRPLVWSWDDRLELLRSIRDGIPMGAIMVWRSSEQKLECYESLGPFKIRRSGGASQYLLDGVQRLSTLLGALSPIEAINDDADEFLEGDGEPPTENFEVHYDFELRDFIKREDIRLPSVSQTLPLSLLFDSVGMLRFQRGMTGSEDEVDAHIEICDQLVAAFRDYKVPVIPIVTEDVEMATRTFQRLNSQGKAMSEAHMIHALSWGGDFNLNTSIRETKTSELAKLGWSDVNDDVILKACKIALGFGVYVKSADEIGRAFKNHSGVVEEVGKACGLAVKFLIERCSISRPDLLPYALQLVLLTNAFRIHPMPTDQQKDRLVSWFWTTTYCEYFAGMSGDRVEKARKDLEIGLSNDNWHLTSFVPFEVQKLNRKFDFRAVRAKAFALRLTEAYQLPMSDSAILDSSMSGAEILQEYGREALLQLLPRTSSQKIIYSSYANRFLLPPEQGWEIKDRFALGEISQTEQSQLLISPGMVSALNKNDHIEFIRLREVAIFEYEKAFYEPHLQNMNVQV